MRRSLVLLAVVALVAVIGPIAAPVPPAPVFVLEGGGWGHGIGMSQWGAYGQAKAGRDYKTILTTYYTGVELTAAPFPPTRKLRLLLADAQGSVSITSAKPFVVADANGKEIDLAPGTVTIRPDLTVPGVDGTPVKLIGPVIVTPDKAGLLTYAGKTYRGELRVAVVANRLQLVDLVGLETYLAGVVPGEMPVDWPVEALKAQAVAARTYAIAGLVKGRSYDLMTDARSQSYYGVGAETPRSSRAVRETKGEILTYDGAPITAFYSSSSGGKTVSALDVYGTDIPYLQSVDDPWDDASPNHRWEPRVYSPEALAQAFKVAGPVIDAVIAPGVAGRPAELRLTTSATSYRWKLTEVRARLGLKSTSFRLGVLRFGSASEKTRAGKPVKLTGTARDVDDVGLEQLQPDGTWSPAGVKLKPTADGTFTVSVRPTQSTTYRLASPGVTGPSLAVRVLGTTA